MPTGLQGYTEGGEGYLGLAISWRPDGVTDPFAFVAPTSFVLAESKSLDQAYTHIERDAYVGSRDTDKGHRHGKAAVVGPIAFALYPTNGMAILQAGLGFKAAVSAIASDTTTAIQNGAMTPPGAPTTTPSGTGGTLAAGTYKYAVTFTSAYGETTLGTATAGDVLSGSTSSDALSAIPVGPPGTTGRNIYRALGAGAFAFVHAIPDNTTATWTDTGATASGAPPTYNTSLPAHISILALTTGSAAYTPGIPILVDTGLNQECKACIKYDAVNKWLYLPLLGDRDGRVITHTSAGTTVVAPACNINRPITPTDFSRNQTNLLPTVSVEDNIGGKYSWQYRGGYVGKINLKATAAKTTVTTDIMFNKPRQLAHGEGSNPSPTAFNDAEADLNDLSFEYQDGFLAIESDQASTQVPMLQRMDDATEWEINFNNNLKEEAPMDGTSAKRYIPGAKRKIDVKLKMLNTADYPVIYTNFVSKDLDATFIAQFAQNVGTDAAPTWKFRSFYMPHVRYVKSTEVQGITDTVGENVEGIARRASGQEKLYSYYM